MLHSMPDNGRSKVRTIINDFLDELSVRDNDVSECPYIVARHDNTYNEHYHIVIRTTYVNGKRFCDKYINKNANRAAACIKYGLQTAKKADEREKAHQDAEDKCRKERTARQHKPSTTQAQIEEKMRRKCAPEKAKERKAKLKYLIEKAAKNAPDFISALAADGLILFNNSKKGLSVKMTDPNGKEFRYGLAKDLGIDINIISPTIISQLKSTNVAATQSSKVPQSTNQTNSRTGSPRLVGVKETPSGNFRNVEHEVRDGQGSDDPDERWKQDNGFKI